jgi:hypothetical protein
LKEADFPEEQYLDALTVCLEKGWLMVLDQPKIDDVRRMIRDDTAFLALPRCARMRPVECQYDWDPADPSKLVPEPRPDSRLWGQFDFTLDGANLYRHISAEWLGPDWEDDLRASVTYSWVEHHYSESEAGFEKTVQEHVAMGNIIRGSRVAPLGPWCVHWWERFPNGFRLELELCVEDWQSSIGK